MVLLLLLVFAVNFCGSHGTSPANVKAKPGEDVCLPCRGPSDADVAVLEWIRSDLETAYSVFFLREKRPYESFQLQSYVGRVNLSDPEMKDGDASLILEKVGVNDTGTYECRVSTDRQKRGAAEATSIVRLTVEGLPAGATEDGGAKPSHLGLLAAFAVFFVVVSWLYLRSLRKNPKQPATDEADEADGTIITMSTF